MGDPFQPLGPLESDVMIALWQHGAGNVRDVMLRLHRPLAYTTVMTTLNRLWRKGILDRRKVVRAFHYAPRYSRQEWEKASTMGRLFEYLGGSGPRLGLLMSFLIDTITPENVAFLDQVEHQVNAKRRELREREKT